MVNCTYFADRSRLTTGAGGEAGEIFFFCPRARQLFCPIYIDEYRHFGSAISQSLRQPYAAHDPERRRVEQYVVTDNGSKYIRGGKVTDAPRPTSGQATGRANAAAPGRRAAVPPAKARAHTPRIHTPSIKERPPKEHKANTRNQQDRHAETSQINEQGENTAIWKPE